MPSPFPGMDPYLESPRFFLDLHAGLIFAMKDDLQGRLSEAYYAQCGQRVCLEEFLVYPIPMQRRLPVITVPLLPEDPPVQLDLQAAFNRAYDAGPYRKTTWYGKDRIEPPLEPDQARWAATTLESLTAS